MSVAIAVIDYGAGNLRSIRRALEAAGAQVTITAEAGAVRAADAVVFPGVGAAGAAMQRLHDLALIAPIRDVVAQERPFLGICLGMQLLFDAQEEGSTRGLGLLSGRVRSLPNDVKVPQIGWNRALWVQDGAGSRAGDSDDFYFVHSYVAEPQDPDDIVAVTRYGEVFPSIVRHGHIWGTQFHPEKSGTAGLRMVAGWVDEVRAQAAANQERIFA
ncbi:MAG: imidazole glycerol phosphate synthase subunit HisH [Thermomicrobiales bacterium]|nr:imidazole glycerol phosphate synthase subunit HisH [Thermomicrobiales bacterium]